MTWRWYRDLIRAEIAKRATKPEPLPAAMTARLPFAPTTAYELKYRRERNRIRYLHKQLGLCNYLTCKGFNCEARPRPS
jgi:hypothetical protein